MSAGFLLETMKKSTLYKSKLLGTFLNLKISFILHYSLRKKVLIFYLYFSMEILKLGQNYFF